MPNTLMRASARFRLLTGKPVRPRSPVTVQLRHAGPGEYLYIKRGDAVVEPPHDHGLVLSSHIDGALLDWTLEQIEPGGTGDRLWIRYVGMNPSAMVWCSWETAEAAETPDAP